MKTLLLILSLLVLCDAAPAMDRRRALLMNRTGGGGGGGGGGHNPPGSPLFLETYEGTGYSNAGWSESVNGGTVDEDYTTTVLDGSQSLYCQGDAAVGLNYTYKTFTAGGNRWAFFLHRPTDINGTHKIFSWNSSISAEQGSLQVNSSGTITVLAGAATATTTDAMSENTTYWIWTEYNKNNGANRICNVGFSTDGTRPTSGNKYAQASTTTSATDVAEAAVGIFGGDFSTPYGGIWDYVIVDDAQIGDNP